MKEDVTAARLTDTHVVNVPVTKAQRLKAPVGHAHATNAHATKAHVTKANAPKAHATKERILEAASRLFAVKGYDEVTMRQIAAEAKRSHTAIYQYYKDKQALLHALSERPLQDVRHELERILDDATLTPLQRLKAVGRATIRFCLANPNTYAVLIAADAGRVGRPDPRHQLNVLRNAIFDLLTRSVAACLPPDLEIEEQLKVSRIYFFMLRGIIGTYGSSKEPLESLMARLDPTFDDAAEVTLAGFRQRFARGRSTA